MSITKFDLANQKNCPHIFSFMIDVFTHKRISPDCPFKSNQRPAKCSILTLRCAVWLRGVMHTIDLDSAAWCTLPSLTTQWDAHHGAWLRSMCTPRSLTPRIDAHRSSAVWCTPQSLTQSHDYFKMSVFVFSNLLRLSTTIYKKKSKIKKIPKTICDLQ